MYYSQIYDSNSAANFSLAESADSALAYAESLWGEQAYADESFVNDFSFSEAIRTIFGAPTLTDSDIDDALEEALTRVPDEFRDNWLKKLVGKVRHVVQNIRNEAAKAAPKVLGTAGTIIGAKFGMPKLGNTLGKLAAPLAQALIGTRAYRQQNQRNFRDLPNWYAQNVHVGPNTQARRPNPLPVRRQAGARPDVLLSQLVQINPRIAQILAQFVSGIQPQSHRDSYIIAEAIYSVQESLAEAASVVLADTAPPSHDDIVRYADALHVIQTHA